MGKQENAWINLRQLINVISSDAEYKTLDDRSQRLLEWIVVNYAPGKSMFVQTIVVNSHVASPATVHKCLSILEREGFIALEVDSRDTRRRIVSPTDRARKLLARLSKRVDAWAESLGA
ncbi:MAG: hypothetical protein EBR85_04610 [Betaproteobacteria bacterium]|jgi:DNA-binding MurR/RpiR family transcriptional regulator|nr:hypothetical protein [Betaproteobacteria bacterium]